jgi:TatA/E family protein of Tat protein translocase
VGRVSGLRHKESRWRAVSGILGPVAAAVPRLRRRNMFQQLGPMELLIILAIVLLLFGVGRVSKIGKELGEAVGGFRAGLKEGMEDEDKDKDKPADE